MKKYCTNKEDKLKVLLLALICLINISLFSQQHYPKATSTYRAKKVGFLNYSGEKDNDRSPQDCNILITATAEKINIYSKQEQIYHILSTNLTEDKNKNIFIEYDCIDRDGNKCEIVFIVWVTLYKDLHYKYSLAVRFPEGHSDFMYYMNEEN